jgi:chromodomain-helicase-DNA-binding protein 1
LHARQF